MGLRSKVFVTYKPVTWHSVNYLNRFSGDWSRGDWLCRGLSSVWFNWPPDVQTQKRGVLEVTVSRLSANFLSSQKGRKPGVVLGWDWDEQPGTSAAFPESLQRHSFC